MRAASPSLKEAPPGGVRPMWSQAGSIPAGPVSDYRDLTLSKFGFCPIRGSFAHNTLYVAAPAPLSRRAQPPPLSSRGVRRHAWIEVGRVRARVGRGSR